MIVIIWCWEAESPSSWSAFSLSGHGSCNGNGAGDIAVHEPHLKDHCVLELHAHRPRVIVHEVSSHYAKYCTNTKERLLQSEQWVGNMYKECWKGSSNTKRLFLGVLELPWIAPNIHVVIYPPPKRKPQTTPQPTTLLLLFCNEMQTARERGCCPGANPEV